MEASASPLHTREWGEHAVATWFDLQFRGLTSSLTTRMLYLQQTRQEPQQQTTATAVSCPHVHVRPVARDVPPFD
jgi:hypothetical protein